MFLMFTCQRLFDEYNGFESELLCEKIFVLEKRGEEGLIV